MLIKFLHKMQECREISSTFIFTAMLLLFHRIIRAEHEQLNIFYSDFIWYWIVLAQNLWGTSMLWELLIVIHSFEMNSDYTMQYYYSHRFNFWPDEYRAVFCLFLLLGKLCCQLVADMHICLTRCQYSVQYSCVILHSFSL